MRVTPWLTRRGHHDFAWQLFDLCTPPLWGYMLNQGTTAIWERWDGGIKGFDAYPGFTGSMNCSDNYSIRAVGQWMWRRTFEINVDGASPPVEHFVLEPWRRGRLTWVRGSYVFTSPN